MINDGSVALRLTHTGCVHRIAASLLRERNGKTEWGKTEWEAKRNGKTEWDTHKSGMKRTGTHSAQNGGTERDTNRKQQDVNVIGKQ